jgi:hypothetical protein
MPVGQFGTGISYPQEKIIDLATDKLVQDLPQNLDAQIGWQTPMSQPTIPGLDPLSHSLDVSGNYPQPAGAAYIVVDAPDGETLNIAWPDYRDNAVQVTDDAARWLAAHQ